MPTKPTTNTHTYSFSGWDKEIVPVAGNTTYTAQFTENDREYTITWLNDEGTLIDTTTCKYGEMPSHANPDKILPADDKG